MVEAGLQIYITTGLANAAIPPGFSDVLPKNQITVATPQAWLWKTILSEAEYVLEGGGAGYTTWTVQIDCHGFTAANSMSLARAIETVLRGSFQGTFADSDSTKVSGIFRKPLFLGGFDDDNRSFVRSLEYEIVYNQI
jgi:hypothetical protein